MDRTQDRDLALVIGHALRSGDNHAHETLVTICEEDSAVMEFVRQTSLRRLRSGRTEPRELRHIAELLVELERLRRREHARVIEEHTRQFNGIRTVLRRLRSASKAARPYVVTEGLCGILGFQKSVYSPATSSGWCPTTIAIHPDLGDSFMPLRRAIAELALPPGLAPREEEAMRTGRSIAVDPEDVFRNTYRPLVELSRPRGYLAVPVIASGRVTGLLHADQHTSEPDETDMRRLQAVATLCALSEERDALKESISRKNRLLHDEFLAFRRVLDELERTDVTLEEALRADVTHDVGGPGGDHQRASLTARDCEVFELLAVGATTAKIATTLFISEGSVKSHIQRIYRTLGVRTRAEAAAVFRSSHRPGGDIRRDGAVR